MKKLYLLLPVLMFLFMPTVKAQQIVLQESFESAGIPATWSQEYVNGEHGWQVETLAEYAYPSGKIPDSKAGGGGSYRAYLRNTTGQTIGYTTRLITPAMDLTGVYRPILRFYHAQDKWTADVDVLRVYYRTDPEEDWLSLSDVSTGKKAEFTKAISKWQAETYELPNFNHKAYQIAFEGTDNMGRGIVLDSIVVRSFPECTMPSDITLTNVANGEATISWHASWDADQFHMVITTKEVNINEYESIDRGIVVIDSLMDYDGIFSMHATGLEEGMTYYVYIQSVCSGQTSEWSTVQSFTMAYRQTLPYTETFSMTYAGDGVSQMQLESWKYGGTYQPVIDKMIPTQYYGIYSRMSDEAVLFKGNFNETANYGRFNTPIPANGLSWMSTPELVGEDLKDCQVRIWATLAENHSRHYANSIVVAVATDATDYSTFVAIDTITIEKKDSVEEYTVSLEKYTGNGKFVALYSNFPKPNMIYIDEVTIEKRPGLQKPDYQTFHIVPDTTSVKLSWQAPTQNVLQYNVVAGNYIRVRNGEAVVTGKVFEQTTATPEINITGLTTWSSNGYFVSVQAEYAGGKSAWSEPKKFLTSANMALPMNFSFEDSEGFYHIGDVATNLYPSNLMLYSTDAEWPKNITKTETAPARSGDKYLYMNMRSGKNTYVVFPKVADVSKTQINFYLTSMTAANKPRCMVELGVMTEPDNIGTFEKVAEYRAGEKWTRCYGNFIEYKGEGKYIALRWMEPAGQNYSTCYIDDVTIGNLVECPIPSGFTYTATDTTAVISWNKGIADKWNVKVNSTPFDDADLTVDNNLIGDMFNGQVATPTVTIAGLSYATTYYVYLQAVCGEDLTEWTTSFELRTECASFVAVPYVEDFNGLREGGVNSSLHPSCWTWGGSNYQYLDSPNSDSIGPRPGSLVIRTNSATEIGWAAMPAIDRPIQDVVLKFDYRAGASTNCLYVGLMSDPEDFSTFEVVDSVLVQTTTWNKDISLKFLKYNGNGKHIAFTLGSLRAGTYNQSWIDYVRVVPVECQAPDLFINSVGADEMTFSFVGRLSTDAEGWQYIVANRELTESELLDVESIPESNVAAKAVTKSDSITVSGLQKQTVYYVYLRALCGEMTWVSASAMTECATIPAKSFYIEDFESVGPTATVTLSTSASSPSQFKKALVPECWTVGTKPTATSDYDTHPEDAATYQIRNFYPFIATNGRASYIASQYNNKGTALTTYHYSNSGVNFLYLRTAADGKSPSWAAMPKIDADTDEDFKAIVVKGSFQMATNAAYRLIVGVMDDPADLSTFTVLDSIGPGQGTGVGKDIEFEIPLDKYTGTGRHIAFRTPYGVSGVQIYLDDIVIDGTGCYTPQSTLSRVTDRSVRLTAGLQGESDWICVLTDKEVTDDKLNPATGQPAFTQKEVGGEMVTVLAADNSVRVIAVDTLPYTSRYKALTGLSASTTYYVSVAAACDLANGLKSQWLHMDFTTLCAPVADFAEDFNSYATGQGKGAGCWIVGNMNSTSNTYIPYVTTGTYASDGTNYLYMYSTKDYEAAYAISPIIDVEDISTKQLRFYARTSTNAQYARQLKVGIMTDPLDFSTLVMIDTIDMGSESAKYLIPFSRYEGDLDGNKGKHIVFYSEFGKTNYAGIDNIELQDIPACAIPGKLYVKDADDTSATLGWVGNSEKYRVVLTSKEVADTTLNKGGAIKNLVLDTVVTGEQIKITSLKPISHYYLHVAGVCGTDTTDFDYAGKHFMTECAPYEKLTYFTDVEEMTEYERPFCWMGYCTDPTETYPRVRVNISGGSYMYSGTKYIELNGGYNNGTIMLSPLFDTDSLELLQIRFYARTGSGANNLYVGVVPEDVVAQGETNALYSNFVALDTLPIINTYQKYTVYFDEFDKELFKGAKRIAIKTSSVSGDLSYYVDDIEIRRIPTCITPEDMWAENSTLHTIDLHFTPVLDTDTKWELAAWDSNAENPDTIYQIVDTMDCVMMNLPSSTIYNISVRSICSETDKSDWSRPIKYSTKYEVDNFKWTFSGEEYVIPVEGTSNYLHPALVGGSNAATSPQNYVDRKLNEGNSMNGTYVWAAETAYKYQDNSRTDGVLRLKTSRSTNSADTTYVILPYVNNPDQKQLTFDLRSGEAFAPDYPATSTYDYYSQMFYSYCPEVIVGTFVDGGGLESFEKLYTVVSPHMDNINESFASPKTGEFALASNRFLFDRVTVPLPTLEGKRLVIVSVFTKQKTSQNDNYACIDNLTIEPKTQAATPQIKAVSATDTTITLSWDANGSTAWDVLLFDSTVYFADTLGSHFVKKISNVTNNSVVIDGLTERTDYYAYLAIAGNIKPGAVSVRQKVRTVCTPPATVPVYDFDDEDEYYKLNTTYWYPNDCWHYGTGTVMLTASDNTPANYLPRILVNTATIGYSRSGKASLKFNTNTSNYRNSYFVLPYQNISDYEGQELVFYMRLAQETLSSKKMTSVFNGITYVTNVIIGMVEDPDDFFNTFTPIDTIYYNYSAAELTNAKLSTDDPNGDKWWQKCVVPLKNGKGKYVAFFQPGHFAYTSQQFFDDITIQNRQTAVAPTNLKVVTAATSVEMSWYEKQAGTGFNVQLSSSSDFATLVLDTTVDNSHPTIYGLSPATHYYWRVRQTGTAYGDSEFAKWKDFWTECVPVSSVETSFENENSEAENYTTTTATMLKNKCWTYDNVGATQTVNITNFPYNIPSTTTVSYARTGSYGLKLYSYSYSTTNVDQRVVTPRIENVDMDTMQLTLWMTPCPHGTSGTYLNQVSAAWAAANAAQVEIGSCTDPDDQSTYVALTTLKYSKYTVSEMVVKAESSEANDYTFQKFIVPLAGAVGPYIYVRAVCDKKPNVGQTSATSSSTVYIDDLSVSRLQVCATPQDLSATNIMDETATLTWTEGDDAKNYIVQVSTDYLFEDESKMLMNDTIGAVTSAEVSGLRASSTYYARLKMICVENGDGIWSQSIVFKTVNAPMFHESFTELNQIANGWTFATGNAKSVFAGGNYKITTVIPNDDANSSNYGWHPANNDEGLSGPHFEVRSLRNSSRTPQWWMITPTVKLNNTDDALLSFKLNYTLYNQTWVTDHAVYAIDDVKGNGVGLTGTDDEFMVIVSDDGGKTWEKENAIIWNNETSDDPESADYVYGRGDNSLNGVKFFATDPTTDDMIRIDLSQYKGKAVRVAFYFESLLNNTNNVLHIDDVHINYVKSLTEENNICQYEDYSSEFKAADGSPLFEVNGDDLESGILEQAAYGMSMKVSESDTLRTLKLLIAKAPQVELPSDTICEGETFSGYDFQPISKTGFYKKKMISQATGCDSITSFYLHVTERVRANAEDTICRGQTYNFNGKMLNRSGLYVDTVTSFVTGCDSIINFMLFVREPEGVSEKVQICNGSTYQFGDTILSTSGIYTRTLTSVSGCDSVVTLDLTVLPELVDTIRDYFCPGSTYKQHGFDVSKAGVYRQSGTSVIGCDSLTVLVLEYYPTDTLRVEFTITTDELPYTYESLTYGVNTFPGTYVDTIAVSGEGCEVTVIHTLHVQLVEGVDNITGNTLTLAPNIISVGELINVVGKFSDKQMRDMNVDIFDMTGKRVATLRPQIQPIAIGGFYQAGIYNIRITAGDGTQYNGRVIVK